MKFKKKIKDCYIFVTVKASFAESINEKELDRFSRVYLRGFLKPKNIKKKVVEYSGPTGISLNERFKTQLIVRDFFFILEQFIVSVEKLHKNNFSIENIVLDLDYIYINVVTKEIQFIYLPSDYKRKSNISAIEFIEKIIYYYKPTNQADADIISDFMYFLRSIKVFDIQKIENYIANKDKTIVENIRKQYVGQSGFMTNKPQHYYQHYDSQNNKNKDEEATSLLVDYDCENTDLLNYDEEATGLLNYDEEATELLNKQNENFFGQKQYQTGNVFNNISLVRIANNEKIYITKSVFRLGKEKNCVDYQIQNNNAISRNHADIIIRDNFIYIKDLNSKNCTYVNDQQVPVNCEVKIKVGDRLRLANEEFILS